MVEQALPYGDGTGQVELPDRTRIVGGGGPSRRRGAGHAAVATAGGPDGLIGCMGSGLDDPAPSFALLQFGPVLCALWRWT